MDIQVKVANKVASVIGSPVIVCGNSDYNISFDFDTEWEGLTVKTARFVYKKDGALQFSDVVFSGTVAAVPVLSGIDEVYLGVYAGELHTTTPARILCKQSILCPNPEPQPEPDADIYKQLLEAINNIPGVLPTTTERDEGQLLKVNAAGDWVVGGCDEAARAVYAETAGQADQAYFATSAENAANAENAQNAYDAKRANILAGLPATAKIHYEQEESVACIYGETDEGELELMLSISHPASHPGYAFYTMPDIAALFEAFPDCAFLFRDDNNGEELIVWHKDTKTGEVALKGRTDSVGGALFRYFEAEGSDTCRVLFKCVYRPANTLKVGTVQAVGDLAIYVRTDREWADRPQAVTLDRENAMYAVTIQATKADGSVFWLTSYVDIYAEMQEHTIGTSSMVQPGGMYSTPFNVWVEQTVENGKDVFTIKTDSTQTAISFGIAWVVKMFRH